MCSRWNNGVQGSIKSFISRCRTSLRRVPATATSNARRQLTQDNVATITSFFNYVDTNKDGFITTTEINEAMGVDYDGNGHIDEWEKVKAGKEWLDTYFAGQNANSDHRISLAELLQWNANNA